MIIVRDMLEPLSPSSDERYCVSRTSCFDFAMWKGFEMRHAVLVLIEYITFGRYPPWNQIAMFVCVISGCIFLSFCRWRYLCWALDGGVHNGYVQQL